MTLKRERLELPDGDFIDLDWTDVQEAQVPQTQGCAGAAPNPFSPIVIVLHGLEGSSNSGYARGLLKAIMLRGWRGVVMHFRGCSGEPNRLSRSYHSGDTGDLGYLIRLLHQRAPHAPLAVVGYSLGGNVLLKWLGETGKQVSLQAAAAVSVPFLLHHAAARLDRGLSRIYQWSLLRRMRRAVLDKRQKINLPITVDDLSTLRSFRDFDEHITAPLHGFNGADHYYAVVSSRQYLKKIAVPTLIVHARDDPFMTEAVIPGPDELSETVELELYPHGGHVGFVSGAWPWRAHYWLEERIPDYLAKHIPFSG